MENRDMSITFEKLLSYVLDSLTPGLVVQLKSLSHEPSVSPGFLHQE